MTQKHHLRNRAAGLDAADDPDLLDELGRQAVFDLDDPAGGEAPDTVPGADAAELAGRDADERAYRERLREYRAGRMTLFTDRKILAGWNGLMLMALSRAAAAFSDRRYLLEAQELADFLLTAMQPDGRLRARLCEGELRFDASLSDTAFCALGFLELYDADLDPRRILDAAALAETIPARFLDVRGGYFDTPADGEALLLRPKETQDGALPCGNSAAAVLLERLFRLTAEDKWRGALDAQLDFLRRAASDYPAAAPFGLTAMLAEGGGATETVAVLPTEEFPEALLAVLRRRTPGVSILVKTPARAPPWTRRTASPASMSAPTGPAPCRSRSERRREDEKDRRAPAGAFAGRSAGRLRQREGGGRRPHGDAGPHPHAERGV